MTSNESAQLFRDLSQIDFFGILFILVIGWLLTTMAEKLIPRIANRLPGRLRLVVLPSVPVIRLVVLVMTIGLVIPRVINPTVESLFAILGATGLAIGFAFKDYITSLLAGIVTIYERPYRPGDWISINGIYGEVQSIGLQLCVWSLRMIR